VGLKELLGVDMPDEEIMALIKEAYDKGVHEVRLPSGRGHVLVRLPEIKNQEIRQK
jgi:hypothetical protein